MNRLPMAVAALAVAVFALLSTGPIASQDPPGSITLAIGAAALSPLGVRFANGDDHGHAPLYGGDQFDRGDFDTGFGLGAALGYRFRTFRVAAEYAVMDHFRYRGNANYPTGGDVQPTRASLAMRRLLLIAGADLPSLGWGESGPGTSPSTSPDTFPGTSAGTSPGVSPGTSPGVSPATLSITPYVVAGVGLTRYDLTDYIQWFPHHDDPSGYLRRGPGGEVPYTSLPRGTGQSFSWTLGAGVTIPVGARTGLDIGYRFFDGGELATDAGDIAIARYLEDGARNHFAVAVNPTVARFRSHELAIALRFVPGAAQSPR